MNITKNIIALVAGLCASEAFAEQHQIDQKGSQFSAESITVKVGDTINFVNQDDIFHNVYSLSDAQSFDLGSYPKGDGREVTFDTAGEVEVECAIHPDMFMTVTVQ